MKSQYPLLPSSYLCIEPLIYLQNFCGLRQATEEFVQFLKSESAKVMQEDTEDSGQVLDKEVDDSLSSFFYTQTFTPPEED